MVLLDNRILVIDDFFPNLDAIINEAKGCQFNVKEALYHGKDADRPVPKWIEAQITEWVERIYPFYFWFNQPRFRLALAGDDSVTKIPHTDSYADLVSPKFSMVIYLSEPHQGTERLGFYQHDSFGKFSLTEFESAMNSDRKGVNDLSRWNEYCSVQVKRNRAVLFPASFFHQPQPGIGFGDRVDNGRLILPVFINMGYRPTAHKPPEPKVLFVNKK